MKEIIKITSRASNQIKKIISEAPFTTEGIVVGLDKSGCSGYSYKIDFAQSSEVKNYDFISGDGFKIFIEPKASIFLFGSEMDYSIDKLSSRFVFNNPNQKNTCGCGESFQI